VTRIGSPECYQLLKKKSKWSRSGPAQGHGRRRTHPEGRYRPREVTMRMLAFIPRRVARRVLGDRDVVFVPLDQEFPDGAMKKRSDKGHKTSEMVPDVSDLPAPVDLDELADYFDQV